MICNELSNYDGGDLIVCRRHYEEYTYRCNCGDRYINGVPCNNESCPDYYEEEEEEDYIQSYSTRIDRFIGDPEDGIYIGVELEVINSDFRYELEKDLYFFNRNSAILKRDSSINGYGFEIVTAAMSLEEQEMYWMYLIDIFGNKIHYNYSCGMHVHLSKRPLSQLQIGKILIFLNDPENSKWIDKIAGRSANSYCQRSKKDLDDVNNPESRYEAVNLMNDATIEFRLFASSNKIEEILTRIEFCHALTKFCAECELDELDWYSFMEYMYIGTEDYIHLKEWIEKVQDVEEVVTVRDDLTSVLDRDIYRIVGRRRCSSNIRIKQRIIVWQEELKTEVDWMINNGYTGIQLLESLYEKYRDHELIRYLALALYGLENEVENYSRVEVNLREYLLDRFIRLV